MPSDNKEEEDNNFIDTSYKAGFWQVYMLGVAMIITGPFSDWNHGKCLSLICES